MNTFHFTDEFCKFLIQCVNAVRHWSMRRHFTKKLANVRSEFFYVKSTEVGNFDIKNLSFQNIMQLHHALIYIQEFQSNHDPIVDVLIDKTSEIIWKDAA